MSYCRWGEADVYVYDCGKGICCCACRFGVRGDRIMSRAAMVEHLKKHRAEGDDVPEDVFERLALEIANGDKPIWKIEPEKLKERT